MWVLDTNVVSEMVDPRPSEPVMDWMGAIPRRELFTTAITEAEIFYGIERLPTGRRRDALREALEGVFSEDFSGKVLAFDGLCARGYARMFAQKEAEGKRMQYAGAQIAAIVREASATLVTRNVRHFAGCGIELLNPWLM